MNVIPLFQNTGISHGGNDFATAMATTMVRFHGTRANVRAAEIADGLFRMGSIVSAHQWIDVCYTILDRAQALAASDLVRAGD